MEEGDALGEEVQLAGEIEDRLSGEIPRRASVTVSGDHDEFGNWHNVDIRLVDPEEGILYEREYDTMPSAADVVRDYRAVS